MNSISGKIFSGATDFNDKTEPEKIFAALSNLLKARLIEKTDGGFRLT